MTSQRKIQLFALGAMLNGAIAMNFMTAIPALASSCTTQVVCIQCKDLNQTQLNNICAGVEPGCTVASAFCAVGEPGCGFPPVVCSYT